MSIQNKIDEVSHELDKIKVKILKNQRLDQMIYRFGQHIRHSYVEDPISTIKKIKLKNREDYILKQKIDRDSDEVLRVAKLFF